MAANACKDLLKSPWRKRTCGLEAVLEDVQDLLTVRSLSNGQMRQLVERIEVDSGGAVEIYLGGGNA